MSPPSRRRYLRGLAATTLLTAGCSLPTRTEPEVAFDAGESVGSRLSLSAGSAFFSTRSGSAHAVDLKSSEEQWSVSVAESTSATPGPTDAGVFCGGTRMVRMDDGEEQWRTSLFDDLSAVYATSLPPVVFDDQVVFGMTDGRLCSLSAATGDVRWTREIGEENCVGWDRSGRTVVASTYDGAVCTLDGRTGTIRNRTSVSGPVSPAAHPDAVYLGGRNVRRLSTDLSAERWSVPTDAEYTYEPILDGGSVFAAGANRQGDVGYLYRIDAETGDVAWDRTVEGGLSGYPLVDPESGELLVGTMETGRVHRFDRDGERVESFELGASVSGSVRRRDAALLALTTDGKLHSIPAK